MASTLLLTVQDGVVRYGDKTLFEGLSFNIREGEKVCLIGKNGAGKTTLMNIITGARELDGGRRWQMQGSTIGYLQQDITPKPGQTVREFIFEALENQDGSHDYKIEIVVEPLQISLDDKMTNLSGGQLRRAALARALVEEPDILLLDEPTNHLDLDVIEWLETYLKSYRHAMVCISHDKTFLEHVSEEVFWLDRGRLKICPKGFGFFEEWSAMLLEQEERELHNRQKVLDQEVEWASRGVKARRKRNVRRVDLMKAERDKLRTDKNALERMLAKIAYTPMEEAEQSSRIAVEFFNVYKSYAEENKFSQGGSQIAAERIPSPSRGGLGRGGQEEISTPTLEKERKERVILDKFNLRIMRGDRIGILGKNGSGKTSFLRLLVGEMKPDAGKVKIARDLEFSYFDQKRKDLIPDHSLQRILCPNGSDYIEVQGKSRHVCGYLKDFLFDPKMVNHPVSSLSGGQKNRLMLAKIMANPGSLLILDEPTNDLDMDTLDMLEDMLSQYTGTLLVVSHDRDFLDQTVSKVLAFEGDGRIDAVIGGYQDYLAKRKNNDKLAGKVDEPVKPVKGKKDAAPASKKLIGKLSYVQEYELKQLPTKIIALEKEIAFVENQLADHELYTRDAALFDKLTRDLAHAKSALDTAEEQWLLLEELRLSFEI